MESLWRKQTKATEMRQQKNKNEAKQAGEAHYEVIVVGAGMAGRACREIPACAPGTTGARCESAAPRESRSLRRKSL